MIRIPALVLIITLNVLLSFADPSAAQRARLENQHAIAALKFGQLAMTGQHRYQLQSVLAWLDLAPTSPDYYEKAQQTVDSLIVQLEPEDSLYFPTQLVRAWVFHEKGETSKAQEILDQASAHLTMADHPLYLWMQFHFFVEDDLEKSQQARKTLLERYPTSPEAHALLSLGAGSLVVSKTPPPKDNKTSDKKNTSKEPSSQNEKFHLQLGAFSSMANAQKAQNDLGTLPEGFQLYVQEDASRGLFLLRLRGFADKDQAHRFAQEELRLEKGQYLVLITQ